MSLDPKKRPCRRLQFLGIMHGLDAVDASYHSANSAGCRNTCREAPESNWVLRTLKLPDDCVSTVAAPLGDWSIRQWPICAKELVNRESVGRRSHIRKRIVVMWVLLKGIGEYDERIPFKLGRNQQL